MTVSVFPKGIGPSRKSKLQPLTFQGFGGGLNTVEDDISMQPSYAVSLVNFHRNASGGQELRFGSNWYADIKSTITGDIVDMEFFSNAVIAVSTTGQIAAMTLNGVVTLLWNATVAAALPGTPAGWSSGLTSIDFVPFKTQLIIHNGIDKPITINSSLVVTYLQDLATGSNVNVPVGKYGCVVQNYHCIAGFAATPTTIYISSLGTAGTFPGDPAPNDAISIDVGAYAPEGASPIRGIAGFRQYLIVFFERQSLLVKLGAYSGTAHIPEFPDTVPNFGALGHRCIIQVENDLLFAGVHGLCSARRNLLSGLIDSKPLSERIEPTYREVVASLTDTQMLRDCFMIHDFLSNDTIMFTPDYTKVLTYTHKEELRYRSWSIFSTQPWTCACRTTLGRVFYAIGSRIFLLGNKTFAGEDYQSDKLNDRDSNWTVATLYIVGSIIRDTVLNKSYKALIQNVSGATSFADDRLTYPTYWEEYAGEAISFEFEMPWLRGRNPMQLKHAKYVTIGSKGNATFTLEVYVDNLYKGPDGTVLYAPALTMDFIGNDAIGAGYDAGPFGGGRRSNDPRLWRFPVKFKTLKPRFYGSARKKLELTNLTFLYASGGFQR